MKQKDIHGFLAGMATMLASSHKATPVASTGSKSG